MAAAATQHALSVPELLDTIFLELKRYSNVSEWQDPQDEVDFAEPDLFHSAQVNRVWRDRALKILWREIPPQAVVHMSFMSPIRQQHYATMVRNMTVDSTPGDRLFDGFELSEQLGFPLVHDLTICFRGEPDWEALAGSNSSRPPNYEKFSLPGDHPLSPAEEGALRGVVDPRKSPEERARTHTRKPLSLSARFPNLASLILAGDDAHVMDVFTDVEVAMENSLKELASAVREWPYLRSLALEGISLDHDRAFSLFGEITQSHSLRDIKMKAIERSPSLGKGVLLATMETHESPFPGLRQAELACSRDDAKHIMNLLSSSRLEALKLCMCDMEGFTPSFEIFYPLPSIQWPPSFVALTDLYIGLGDDNEIRATDILAIGKLVNLRGLSIVVAGMGASGNDRFYPVLISDLDDGMFATLCDTLPRLESLALHMENRMTAAALLSCGRSCRNLQRITMSGIFDLATVTCGDGNGDLFPELVRLELGEIEELTEYPDMIQDGEFDQVIESVEVNIRHLLKLAPKMQKFSMFGLKPYALVDTKGFKLAYRLSQSIEWPECWQDVFQGVAYMIYY